MEWIQAWNVILVPWGYGVWGIYKLVSEKEMPIPIYCLIVMNIV